MYLDLKVEVRVSTNRYHHRLGPEMLPEGLLELQEREPGNGVKGEVLGGLIDESNKFALEDFVVHKHIEAPC